MWRKCIWTSLTIIIIIIRSISAHKALSAVSHNVVCRKRKISRILWCDWPSNKLIKSIFFNLKKIKNTEKRKYYVYKNTCTKSHNKFWRNMKCHFFIVCYMDTLLLFCSWWVQRKNVVCRNVAFLLIFKYLIEKDGIF